jgi:hypothetical protein
MKMLPAAGKAYSAATFIETFHGHPPVSRLLWSSQTRRNPRDNVASVPWAQLDYAQASKAENRGAMSSGIALFLQALIPWVHSNTSYSLYSLIFEYLITKSSISLLQYLLQALRFPYIIHHEQCKHEES